MPQFDRLTIEKDNFDKYRKLESEINVKTRLKYAYEYTELKRLIQETQVSKAE
jgi:chromosome segregation ATPase